MAGICEKEAEAMVHAKGADAAAAMVMAGAVPYQNNCCRSLDGGYYQLGECYRVAEIREKEAEAMVHAKGAGAAVAAMVMAGAAPHRNNCCRPPDGRQQNSRKS